jgi:ABC-type dipeptide/oligopeptide/nickel transport system ATPase component
MVTEQIAGEINMESLKSIDAKAEKIGAVGSPSSTTEIALDILGTAVNKKLVGEMAYFSFPQDGKEHYAMGQITEIQLRNLWLEDATMRSLARQRGQVNPISGQQDTHLGQMNVSAVFADNSDNTFSPSMLGTVPSTGTWVNLATDPFLDTLLHRYKEEIFYLGKVYGSSPKLPLWFKHFGSGKAGAGEAYHLGVFGKTGSGKSVLAKMIMLAYSRHSDMSIFVIDPQGEFAKDCSGQVGHTTFRLPVKEQLEKNGKNVLVYGIKDLVLDRWELFAEIIAQSKMFDKLTISHSGNKEKAVDSIVDKIRDKVKLVDLFKKDSFSIVWNHLGNDEVQKQIFSSAPTQKRLRDIYQKISSEDVYNKDWKPLCLLFTSDESSGRSGAKSIYDLLTNKVFSDYNANKPIVVIDLSKEKAGNVLWNDKIQAMVVKRLLDAISDSAEQKYRDNKLLNTLIIIDEAHRLAPRERIDDEVVNSVKQRLVDAVRTTRKFGLGWMFISQTLSSLDRGIVEMLRIMFFGFGLALGTEYSALRELAGGDKDALKLYQTFRDPHSTFDLESRQYSFMSIGPVSPLSFSGKPLFFTAFNDPREFLSANQMKLSISAQTCQGCN